MVGRACGAQRRLGLDALLLDVGAPGGELASLGRVDQVGRPAGDGLQSGMAGVGQAGDGVHQRPGVGHLGVGEQGLGGGPLHDPTGVHDGDLIGPIGHHPEVVGDQHHGHVTLPLEVGQEVQDLGLHGDVQPGGGLVRQDQPR